MKKHASTDERGVGHIGIIVIVAVLALVGVSGWFVYSKQQKAKVTPEMAALQKAIATAKCDYDDKDLCKFFASWKVTNAYRMTTVSTDEKGQSSQSLIEIDGNKSHHKFTVSGKPYEAIYIGLATYTKNDTDGTWWKQTAKPTDPNTETTNDEKINYPEPSKETEKDKTTYKKIGTEKCGKLTCFKYQVFNISDADAEEFIWFDMKDYQIRRNLNTHKSGMKSDTTFDYTNVSIKAPSPTKELGPNQYIVPGQSEPATLPSAGDTPSQAELDKLMQEYQDQNAE